MKYPTIGENDLIYTYKEQWFTGFAPCFNDGIYSLACCKGRKNGGGMRNSICEKFEEGKTIWVLGIAGTQIDCVERNGDHHNCSKISYKPGDVIYLAKIGNTLTLKEYTEKYPQRKDAIYTLYEDKIVWNENIERGGNNEHNGERFRLTDCTLEYSDWCEKKIFNKLKQIIMATEYYVFNSNQKICETLNIGRAFTFKKNKENVRVQALNIFLRENHNFKFIAPQNPFNNAIKNQLGRCSK